MGPDEVLITCDVELAERIRALFDGRVQITPGWVARARMPRYLLIIDVAALPLPVWRHAERWSRQPARPSLVLIDDGRLSRELLARVAADSLVPYDANDAELKDRIREHMWEHPFLTAAEKIRTTPDMPHPLSRFLSSAFTARCRKVSTLALSLGISQSTLRNQWVRFRSDPALRLEDVLHRVDDLRENTRQGVSGTVSCGLEDLVRAITSQA